MRTAPLCKIGGTLLATMMTAEAGRQAPVQVRIQCNCDRRQSALFICAIKDCEFLGISLIFFWEGQERREMVLMLALWL